MSNQKSSFLKFICDFLPLIMFFVVYKTSKAPHPLISATICLLVVTFFALAINYFATKKIAIMPLFSAIVLGIFGFLTIFSGNEMFIKVKPTLINLVFAIILLTAYFLKKPWLKALFGSALEVSNEVWLNLSLRWAGFFIFLAFLNEVIWRNSSTEFWVQFKVFGILPISILFACLQIPYIIRNSKTNN